MGNRGFAIVASVFIVIVLAAIGIFAVSMLSTDIEISSDTLRSTQAFYIAEAGLERVFCELKNDGDFRATPTTVTGNIGEGSFSVTVTKDASTYTLTSTGTVGAVQRRMTQTVVATPDVFDYAVSVNENDLLIDNNVAIVGDVYGNEDVEVTSNASVTGGLVYADDVTGSGTYTEASDPPDPVPTYPTFNTTWYDTQISNAGSPDDLTVSEGTLTLDAEANNNYKKLTVQGTATVEGPGTIVCTDNVELKDDGTITSNVSIISDKQILMSNDGHIESGALTYANEGFILQNDAIMDAANIIVPTSGYQIEMKDNSNMTGAVYANHLKLQNYASIVGSVVTNTFESDKIQDDVTVTYSEDVLGGIPTGMEASSVTVRVQTDWDEIGPS